MSNSRRFLGQTVTVEIDRPLGSQHPKHPHIIYPVNYGYIPGTVSGDGEPLDAYVLGIDEELAEFTGVVHAIIHRLDDDDKLIVAPAELDLTDDDIIEATHFQEQYFESEIWRTES